MEIMSANVVLQKLDPSKKTVVITGVSGQDGSFMVDYLLKNTDYNIVGGARRLSVENHRNLSQHIFEPRLNLVSFDLSDRCSIDQIMTVLKPAYFINFAAQSDVKKSWDFPDQTSDVNTGGVIRILESIRQYNPSCRFYNAGSSEEFGNVICTPQDESHPLRPRSPYGASKASARHYVKVYRESYGLYAVQAWLFNHEGTRRGEDFVTRKVTRAVVNIKREIATGVNIVPLELGNLDATRDWSDAEDCVEAVWLMMNQVYPLEYVVSSNETHSIREFVEESFAVAGIKGRWVEDGVDEKFVGGCSLSYDDAVLVKVNPAFYRPAEVEKLCGNSNKIREKLGWKPKVTFKELVRKMVEHDICLSKSWRPL